MGNIVKRRSGKWELDAKKIKSIFTSKNIDLSKEQDKIDKEIVKEVLGNIFFLRYFLKETKKNSDFKYVFCVEIEERLYRIEISYEKIMDFFDQEKAISIYQEKFIDKLKYYKSKKYLIEEVLAKEIREGVTYHDIISLLKMNSHEFEKIMLDNNFFGLTGEQLLEIVNSSPINYFPYAIMRVTTIMDKLDFSDEEKKDFRENVINLNYLYEKEEYDDYKIKTSRDLVDKFELNDELFQSIMREIPKEFNDLQKAYYIYKRLCQKFSYDQEYYYYQNYGDKAQLTINHNDFNRLTSLNGGQEIICTEISLLFAKFLDKMGIPFMLLGYDNKPHHNLNSHMKVRFRIGKYVVDADPADGLIKSDLVTEKTEGRTMNFCSINTAKRNQNDFYSEIEEVDRFFDENITEFNDAREMYRELYERKDEAITLEERIQMFIDVIRATKSFNLFEVISNVSNIRKSLFSNYAENIKIEFIMDKSYKPAKLNIVLVYNSKNELLNDLNDNKYIVINSEREISEINYEELKELFDSKIYDYTAPNRNLLGFNGSYKGERKKDEKEPFLR